MAELKNITLETIGKSTSSNTIVPVSTLAHSATITTIMPEQSLDIGDTFISTSSIDNSNTKITPNDIYSHLDTLLGRYNITMTNTKKDKLIKDVFDISVNDFCNSSNSQNNNITTILAGISKDFETYISEAFKRYPNKSIDEIIQQAKDWHIAIKQGKWSSIEKYEQAQQGAINTYGKPEGIIERVNRVTIYNISSKNDPSEIESAITAYAEWVVKEAQKVKDPTSYITRDLVRLINNTEDDNIRNISPLSGNCFFHYSTQEYHDF